MWFDLGRSEGFPSQYPPNSTPVTVDVLEAGIITAFLILAVTLFISQVSTVFSKSVNLFIRIGTTLFVGLCIVLGNFGQEWETSHIVSRTPYRPGIAQQINASIGLKIGLRGINVTLANVSSLAPEYKNEIINYNERFEWTWDQGRFGFGPFAGRLQREFRAAQYRGVPIPILWVAECFVIDGEGFRFGRFYRTAGWYCHITLWTAFASWIIAVILLRSVIRFGAYWLLICGCLQIFSNILWVAIRNPLALKITFEDQTIKTKYGVSFWLTLFSGISSCLIAIAIIVMDAKYETMLFKFFNIDPIENYEVAYLTKEEEALRRHKTSAKTNDMPLIEMSAQEVAEADEDEAEYLPVYVKRSVMRSAKPLVPPKVDRRNKPKHLVVPP